MDLPSGQLAVAVPTVPVVLDTHRIVVQSGAAENLGFEGSQWSDSTAFLVQARVVRAFENANYLRVAKSESDFPADHRLLLDIRRFRVSTDPAPIADIAFTAKLLGPEGRITAARMFQATAPISKMEAPAAVEALNAAFGKAARELVIWVLAAM
jgi:phospholipid/cholesterol/gamma-HCH transport system substrate-binding protein